MASPTIVGAEQRGLRGCISNWGRERNPTLTLPRVANHYPQVKKWWERRKGCDKVELEKRAKQQESSVKRMVKEELTESSEMARQWAEAEMQGVDLGDKRLNWRLVEILTALAAQPMASIPQAALDWAATKATYRLLDNEKVSNEKIYAPHYARTQARLVGHPLVLAVQDTTLLDFTTHPQTQGLGAIGTSKQKSRGMVMHSALLLTPQGLSLGLGSQRLWVRAEQIQPLTREERRKQPLEDKESYKWLQALTQVMTIIPAGTQVVHVGDSEADVYELFLHAQSLQSDLLIRAAQERKVAAPEVGLLWETMNKMPVQGRRTLSIPKRQAQAARTAQLTLRFAPVTLNAPVRAGVKLPPCSLYAILVQEQMPPAGVKPVEWLLLTTVAVETLPQAQERIDWYCQRWQIEIYHKTLKSGCRIEASQLETAQRLMRLAALYSLIAWRLLWLTHLARHQPEASCTQVLAEHEWRALYAHIKRSSTSPPQPPTLAEALLWIARLGGFLARRGDGSPGVTVIWRGWQRLNDIADTWRIFNPSPLVGND